MSEEGALRELVLRYLQSHGLAPDTDIAWWSKLPLRGIRSAIADLDDQLTALNHKGQRLWCATDELRRSAAEASSRRPSVLALPGFDEWLLGYGDRSPSLASEHAQLIVPGNNGVFKPTVVHNGRVIGLWSKKTVRGRLRVSFAPVAGSFPNRILPALRKQAERVGNFLGVGAGAEFTDPIF